MSDTTSIASFASSAAQTQQVAEQNIAVARKALDSQKAQGEAAVGLIDSAGQVEAANRALARPASGRVDVFA